MTSFELQAPQEPPQDPPVTTFAEMVRRRKAGLSAIEPGEQDAPTGSADEPPTLSPLNHIIQLRQLQKDQTLLFNLSQAIQVDPELAGEAQRLGIETGLHPESVRENIEQVRELHKRSRFESFEFDRLTPALRARLESDPFFAQIAQDNTDQLNIFEKLANLFINTPGELLVLAKLGTSINVGGTRIGFDLADEELEQMNEILGRREAGMIQAQRGALGTRAMITGLDLKGAQALERMNAQLAVLPQTSPGLISGLFNTIGQFQVTVPTVAATAGAGALAGSVIPGVGTLALGGAAGLGAIVSTSAMIEGGNQFLDLIDAGVEPVLAARIAVPVGIISGVLEAAGFQALAKPVKDLIRKNITKGAIDALVRPTTSKAVLRSLSSFGQAVGGEVGTEVGQEFTQMLGDIVGGVGPQSKAEAWERISGIIVETIASTAILGGIGVAVNLAQDLRMATTAEQNHETFERLMANAKTDKTRDRNQVAYEGFAQASMAGQPAKTVYIDGAQMQNTLDQAQIPIDELERVMPGITKKLEAAVRDGGDVVISMAEYTAKLAGTDLDGVLRQDLRLNDPAAPSLRDLGEFKQDPKAQEEVKKIVEEELTAAQQFEDSAKVVEGRILAEIKGVGLLPKEQERAAAFLYRQLVGAQAARSGISPEQFDAQNPLRVSREEGQPPTAEVLQQGFEVQQRRKKDVGPPEGEAERREPLAERAARQTKLENVSLFIEQALGPPGFASIEEAQAAQQTQLAEQERRTEDVGPPEGVEEGGAASIPAQFFALETQLERDVFMRDQLEEQERIEGIPAQFFALKTQLERDLFMSQQLERQQRQQARPLVKEEAAVFQEGRGRFIPPDLRIDLNKDSEFSTWVHELSHYYLVVLGKQALNPGANAGVINDMEILLDWFGIADLATWDAMSVDQQRPHHEAFANNLEVFYFEGKAPSTALEKVFQRIRTWMVNVYKVFTTNELRAKLSKEFKEKFGIDLPEPNDQVRDVFDRMLAADKAISLTEAARAMLPMFQDQTQSGMSDTRWATYQRASDEYHEDAVTDLMTRSLNAMKWLSGQTEGELGRLQREHDKVRRETRKEVEAVIALEPVYRAIKFLQSGRFTNADGTLSDVQADHRMDTELARALLPTAFIPTAPGVPGPKPSLDQLRGMTKQGGVAPDDVAGFFGFNSGEEMIRAIVQATPSDELATSRTDQRMESEHSDLMDPGAMQEAVEKALHNPARAKFVAAEWRALSGAPGSLRDITRAAMIAAREALALFPVERIKPRDFSGAEQRSRKAAQKASSAGDIETAIAFKRKELLQNLMAAEAVKVREELGKVIDVKTGRLRGDFRQVQRPDEKLAKRRNVDFVGAARAVMAAWGLGPGETPALVHLKDVKRYAPQRHAELSRLVADATFNAKDWRQATLEEFRAATEAIRALWFLARRDRMVIVDGQKVDAEVVITDVLASLRSPGITRRRSPLTDAERKALPYADSRAWVKRVENWTIQMDGGQPGAVHKHLFRRIREPFDDYVTERLKLEKEFSKRIDALNLRRVPSGLVPGAKARREGQKIAAPELDFTFNNMAELIGALKHAGNISNLRKLILGERFQEMEAQPDGTPIEFNPAAWWTFIERMVSEKVLTREHFEYVQFVWDSYEALLPRMQEAHFEVNGFRFEEIEAVPLMVTFPGDTDATTFRGGYVPATVDRNREETRAKMAGRSLPVESDPLVRSFEEFRTSATPSKGFTFSRVEYNQPLRLSITMDTSHLDEHLRYIHMAVPARDILRIIRDPDVSEAITALDHFAIDSMFLPFLDATVHNRVIQRGQLPGWFDDKLIHLRKSTGAGIMLLKATTGVQQLTGIGNSSLHVKPGYLISAAVAYLGGGQGARASDKSKFMDLRINSFMGQLRDDIDVITRPGWLSKFTDWTDRHAFFVQRWFQTHVDIVTWNGRYEQGIAEGLSESDAVAAADSAVRISQGSGTAPDISRIERGNPLFRIFLQFSNFWLTSYNTIAMRDGWVNKAKAAAVITAFAGPMAALFTLPLKGGLSDDDNDGDLMDDVGWWLFNESLNAAASATVPVVGPIALRTVTGEFGGRIGLGAVGSTLESAGSGLAIPFRMGWDLLSGDDIDFSQKDVKDTAGLWTVVTGLPLIQIGRMIAYGVGVATGEIESKSPLDTVRGVLTGEVRRGQRR